MIYINKYWLTLVELLVVVSILAILSTLWTLYLFWNFEDSRDAARSTDITLISENLELFYSSKSRYPFPDDGTDILYWSGVAWTQWVFWQDVSRDIRNFWSYIPQDPKYENYYTYSITNDAKEYQIATIFEWLDADSGLWELAFVSQAHASIPTAYVKWDFNNVMVRSKYDGEHFFIATPSIIATDISIPDAEYIITNQKLVFHEFFNLPSSYNDYVNTEWWFAFNVSDPLVFSGSLSDLKTDQGLADFKEKLQFIYATTPTESFDVYRSILDSETQTKTKNFLNKHFSVRFWYPFDCRDIFDAGDADWDRMYTVDQDGDGPLGVTSVYCDMTTWGWGWTQRSTDYISNGSLGSWNGVVNSVSFPWSAQNQIIVIDNPAYSGPWYALHQTGSNESYYEIKLDNISDIQIWDEIRLTAWFADEDDGSWSNSLSINPSAYYPFYNEIQYTDGTFSTNGKMRLIETAEFWGKTWKLLQVRHTVRKEIQDFSWYLWRDTENTKDLYAAWIDVEVFYGGYNFSEDSGYIPEIFVYWGTNPVSSWPSWWSSWWPSWWPSYISERCHDGAWNSQVLANGFWDLRDGWCTLTSGTAAGNDIRYKDGITMTRNVSGIQFSWINNWSSWVKFETASWNRGEDKTIEWIFSRPTSNNMMVGIGSLSMNETSTRQYSEAEFMSYYQRNSWWRFRGVYWNRGTPWQGANDTRNVSLLSCSSQVFKNKITFDGTIWSAVNSVYCLPSGDSSDWDDESDLEYSYTPQSSLNPDEEVLIPVIIPRVSGSNFIGLRVE